MKKHSDKIIQSSLSEHGTLINFQERLEYLIHTFSNNSQRQFAKSIGLTQNKLNRIVNGSEPKLSDLIAISGYTDVSLNWLVWGIGEPFNEINEQKKSDFTTDDDTVAIINIYDNHMSMGNGSFIDESVIVDNITISKDFIRSKWSVNPADIVGIRAVGDSMAPLMLSGDIALIDRSKTTMKEDAIYAFRFDNSNYIKRLQRIGRNIRVISENPEYADWDITPDDLQFLKIYGKVLSTLR